MKYLQTGEETYVEFDEQEQAAFKIIQLLKKLDKEHLEAVFHIIKFDLESEE